MNYPRGARILTLLGLASILLALIFIHTTPARGYETSIYESVLMAWVSLTIGMICGLFILSFSILDRLEGRKWVATGLFLLLLGNVIILLIPVMRGGPFYGRQDMLSHIGFTLDIIHTGNYSMESIYPVSHIIAAISALSMGKSASFSLSFLIPVFVILGIMGIILLSRLLLIGKARIFSMIGGATLIISYAQLQVIPNAFSIFLIPFAIYIYLKMAEGKSKNHLLIMIILLTVYAFFHPLVMIMLLIVLTAISILERLIPKNRYSRMIEKYPFKIPLIGTLILIIWLSSHDFIWSRNISQLIIWLSGESTIPSFTGSIGGVFELLNLRITDVAVLFVKMYGHILIFFILTSITLLHLIRRIFVLKERHIDRVALLALWFPVTVIILIINLFWPILHMGIWRMVAIIAILAPPFVGLCLGLFFQRSMRALSKLRRSIGAAAVLILLFTPILIGIMSVYPSPWTIQANEQVIEMEIIGLIWHYEKKDSGLIDNYIRTSRFSHAILGIIESKDRTDIPMVERSSTRMNTSRLPIGLIPPHFDYANWSRYPEIENMDIYLPISEYDIVFNTRIYPELDEFNEYDFKQLTMNTDVVKTYDNGGLSVYLLYGLH